MQQRKARKLQQCCYRRFQYLTLNRQYIKEQSKNITNILKWKGFNQFGCNFSNRFKLLRINSIGLIKQSDSQCDDMFKSIQRHVFMQTFKNDKLSVMRTAA